MKGFAYGESIIPSAQDQKKIERIEKIVRDEKNYDNVIIEIEDLLKKLPSHPRLNYLLAFCLDSNNERLADAIKHYDLALKFGHDEFCVKFYRGKLYLKVGELEKAGLDLEHAIKLKPSDEATEVALKEIENLQNRRRLENEIKLLAWINQAKSIELKSAIKDCEVLHDINISYEKTIAVNQNRINQLKHIEKLRNVNINLEKTIAVNQNRINQLNEANKALDAEIRNLNTMIDKTYQSVVISYEKTIAVNQNRINQLNEANKALDAEIRNLNTMIDKTYHSFTWRLIRRYNAIVYKS